MTTRDQQFWYNSGLVATPWDHLRRRDRIITIIEGVVVDLLPVLTKDLQKCVTRHILHEHSAEMSKKTHVVSTVIQSIYHEYIYCCEINFSWIYLLLSNSFIRKILCYYCVIPYLAPPSPPSQIKKDPIWIPPKLIPLVVSKLTSGQQWFIYFNNCNNEYHYKMTLISQFINFAHHFLSFQQYLKTAIYMTLWKQIHFYIIFYPSSSAPNIICMMHYHAYFFVIIMICMFIWNRLT